MLGDIVSVSGYHFEEEEYVWYLEITVCPRRIDKEVVV
jgi:hypothetical protein